MKYEIAWTTNEVDVHARLTSFESAKLYFRICSVCEEHFLGTSISVACVKCLLLCHSMCTDIELNIYFAPGVLHGHICLTCVEEDL